VVLSSSRLYIWFGVNVVGLLLYLWFGSKLWVIAGEEGTPGGPGDAFAFLFGQMPILVFFCFANFIAIVSIIAKSNRSKLLTSLLLWGLVAILWLGVVFYDHSRTVRFIKPEYSLLSIEYSFVYES
jgi:hypothetical protein